MTALLFPCEACVQCGPCPDPLKLEAWKYNKKECVSGSEVITETVIALGISYPYPVDPLTGIIGVTYSLATLAAPTVPVYTGALTIGQRLYRKPDGGCDYTGGTMWFAYDPRVHVVVYLEVQFRYPAPIGTLTKLVYMDDGPGYYCKPCTNQRGESVNKIGSDNTNTANLTPSTAGAVGSDCSSGSGTARIKEVSEWLGAECCPAVSLSGNLAVGTCSPDSSAQKIGIYKDGGLCGSITTYATVTCTSVTKGTASLLDFPRVHSGTNTLSLSTADGDVSLSVTINKSSCGNPTVSGVCVMTANDPPAAGCGSGSSATSGSCFIDIGHPCYKYKLTANMIGSFYEDNIGFGCGYCNGTTAGCNGYASYNNVRRYASIGSVTLEVVPL